MKLKATTALLTAFNHTKDGIIVSSKNHEIQFVNPGMERLLGYKCDDLVGRYADELHKNELLKNDVSDSINTSVRKGKVSDSWIIVYPDFYRKFTIDPWCKAL